MEDSGSRRERFQAMRLEAEVASSSRSFSSPSSFPPSLPLPQLFNSLLYPPPAAESSPSAPRFDCCMDPMSAFSGAKRRAGPGACCSPIPPLSRPNVVPRAHLMSPAHPLHATESPGSTSHEMFSQFPQSTAWRSIQYLAPYSRCQGTPLSGPSHFSQNTSWRSPVQYSAPYPGCQGTPVGVSGGSGSSFSYSYPSTPKSGCFSSCYGRGGSSHVSKPGMRGSPHSNSGRGKGGLFSGNRSPHRTGGRSRGSDHNGSLGQQDVEHYYRKSMVKDPWCDLKPIIRGLTTKPRYWPLDSKKAKVTESGKEYNFSKTGCLARLLAESFEEVATET